MTTVSQSTSFMRATTEGDVILEVTILKLGRQIVFGEVTLYADGEGEGAGVPLAHAACTYALLAEKS
jgi:acyl-coenzyme A thioesterase PaaI-like protein